MIFLSVLQSPVLGAFLFLAVIGTTIYCYLDAKKEAAQESR